MPLPNHSPVDQYEIYRVPVIIIRQVEVVVRHQTVKGRNPSCLSINIKSNTLADLPNSGKSASDINKKAQLELCRRKWAQRSGYLLWLCLFNFSPSFLTAIDIAQSSRLAPITGTSTMMPSWCWEEYIKRTGGKEKVHRNSYHQSWHLPPLASPLYHNRLVPPLVAPWHHAREDSLETVEWRELHQLRNRWTNGLINYLYRHQSKMSSSQKNYL